MAAPSRCVTGMISRVELVNQTSSADCNAPTSIAHSRQSQELLYRGAVCHDVDDFIRAILQEMPPEERLRGLDPDALRSLDPEDREMLRQMLGKLK
jgi:hypothetical protein